MPAFFYDDKDTIRDLLNSVLGLDRNHEIIDLEYEFEKPIDVFMPEDALPIFTKNRYIDA